MKNRRAGARRLLSLAAIFTFAVALAAATLTTRTSAAEKVNAEDLLTKHLNSIGSAEARAAARSRIITGVAQFTFRLGGSGTATGNAVLASEGQKSLLSMAFGAPDYPHDIMGFNGKDLKVRDIRPGVRSLLGEVLMRNSELFREGIIGGTLSAAWPLANNGERSPKLESAGTDKIDGRDVYKFRYIPRKGSEFKITLFFDAENFRHVRTQYDKSVPAPMGGIDSSARQRETNIKMIEDFSDFRTEANLLLPHTYKIQYSAYGQNNGVTQEWVFKLSTFSFEPVDDKAFNLVAE
ncbi:MAG TPA: hypothetical protein VNA19_15245 [Pyrinomonadaceae bacterium]|jgi:hypothetical protein|nr:hypothetical protein [Pyrinomonadaceae bacterium]